MAGVSVIFPGQNPTEKPRVDGAFRKESAKLYAFPLFQNSYPHFRGFIQLNFVGRQSIPVWRQRKRQLPLVLLEDLYLLYNTLPELFGKKGKYFVFMQLKILFH
jgi:hypothetical protein